MTARRPPRTPQGSTPATDAGEVAELLASGIATQREREWLEAIIEHGSGLAAARALGNCRTAALDALDRVRKRHRARQGKAPGHWNAGTAPGYYMHRAKISRNGDGSVAAVYEDQRLDDRAAAAELDARTQALIGETHIPGNFTVHRGPGGVLESWERFAPDQERRQRAIEEALDRRIDRITPLPEVPAPRAFGPEKLLTQVSIFDGHIGALAWHPETGSGNWDMRIARESMIAGMAWLFDNLPAAQDALLLIGGDFTETDGYAPVTPGHGHLLDADGRYPRIFEVAEEVIEAGICHALRRHRHVTVSIRPGNHDPSTAFTLRRVFMRAFRDNPRVLIDESLKCYWAMLFGKTLIACHHGDKKKLGELPGVFAADFAEMWGQATYRVCHSGHWHHEKSLQQRGVELTGMMMYQHPTIERRNAWAAGKGLIAARQLVGHSYHAGGALVTQLHYNPDVVEAAL